MHLRSLLAFLALLYARSYVFSPFARVLSSGLTSQDVIAKLPWLLISGGVLPLIAAWLTLRRYMRV